MSNQGDGAWRRTSSGNRIGGYLWWCGDDECDCYQPLIVELVPNSKFPKLYEERALWEGTFHSSPTADEVMQMQTELRDECERRGVPVLKA